MGGANSAQDRVHTPGKSHVSSRASQLSYAMSDGDIMSREKKKKASRFATLRRKLIRVRRHSRSFDYSKVMRELTSTWNVRDLKALVEEYDSLAVLKEFETASNLARPSANTIRQDLCALFDYKYCTDIDLVYHGACFPAHRALLCVRCPFFREILARYPDSGCQVPIKVKTPGVDVTTFAALLRYLYTDELKTDGTLLENAKVLSRLIDEFGMPNPLDHDLKILLETTDYSDAVLVFTSNLDHVPDSTLDNRQELRCHKAILAARSPFFRNLLMRRARTGEEQGEGSLAQTLLSSSRILLDESVIPRQYARVLLHSLYLDTVDLSCIVRGSTSTCSLSEVQAMVAGKGHMTHADEAMEIHQIGQFLDFTVLSQGCEDIIIDSINIDNLISVLLWSSEPHGSQWVHRQALHYLRDEFHQISHSSVLHELSKEYLVNALKSDFLQVGELDVLTAVMKWGEHHLMRRMEDREPNILSHTAHSVTRKGIKKRDLNDVELRDILADLLPLVRMDHVIPRTSDVLCNAIKRGLVSSPPSHMLGDDTDIFAGSAWVRGKNNGMYMRPRLFIPYYEEAKALLEEQLTQHQESDLVRVRMIHMSSIPDTLYMVDEQQCVHNYPGYIPTSTATVDVIAGTIPVPDRGTLLMMIAREDELQQTKLAKRAYSMPYMDKRAVTYQIQLRVVREFGLPDTSVEVLQNVQFYYPCDFPYYVDRHYAMLNTQSSPVRKHHTSLSSSTPISPARSYSPIQNEACACSESVLNEMMPDIAMATTSLNQVSLQDQDMELDLGDGSNHSNHSTLGSSNQGTLYI